MSRRPPALHLVAVPLGAAVLALALAGCGGSDGSDGGGSGAEAPSQADLTAFQEQTATDAESVATDVVAQADGGSLPESADGLGTLSDGNRLGSYTVDGTTAQLCVEHVVDDAPVAFTSWYVDVAADPARSSELSKGLNAGCS